MKYIPGYIIALFLLAASCTKVGKNVTVTGHVLNPITGEGISGAELHLLRGTGGIPGGYKSIKEAFTDETGYFEINKMTLSKVILRLHDDGDLPYYKIGWHVEGSYIGGLNDLSVKKGKKMQADYHMVPYGEIKTSLHNVNCEGPNDTLIFNRTYISFETEAIFQPFILTGCYDNDGAYAQVPSGDYLIEWTVIRSGVSNSYSHVLNVPANGQASYNIDY